MSGFRSGIASFLWWMTGFHSGAVPSSSMLVAGYRIRSFVGVLGSSLSHVCVSSCLVAWLWMRSRLRSIDTLRWTSKSVNG
ncbi:hypothetical protein DY000_02002186 [Brassica cretica]|uniref:Secreted protein n=1 Tax=Brassica cretica TaxID=69181 RepID=A0ABQ7C8P7_BRACR|nr:hypothetical protein DY000_02002186 [Brassica cretica]